MDILRKYLARFWAAIKGHKLIAVIAAALIIGGGYYVYGFFGSAPGQTRYVLAAAQNGTLVVSVAGNGQVAASDQVDVKPKASADVISVAVHPGQSVQAGDALMSLDATDARQTVQNAENDLQSAKLSMAKLQEPATPLSITEAQNAITQAQQSLQAAQINLKKDYGAGLNSVSSAFVDLPTVMTGLNTVLNGIGVSQTQNNIDAYYDLIKNYAPNAQQFHDTAASSYVAAKIAFQKNLNDYQSVNLTSSVETLGSLTSETYATAQTIAQAIKDAKSFLDLVGDTYTNDLQSSKPPAILATNETNLQSYTGTATAHLNDLLGAVSAITNDQNDINSANETISEKQQSLASLQTGADPLDVQSQQLGIQGKENALAQAQADLADYTVRAPFDGLLATVTAKKGDSVSVGTAVATLISANQVANISLNEVDVAKVSVGQKATLTFDAVPDLTIAGHVAQIDALGTVSQGVVNYNVEIAFDTQDARIKPGMSVAAAVITDQHQDVLLVPNAAVKTQNGSSYVQVEDASSTQSTLTPTITPVEIGLSNDSMTEITSGLSAGQMVVTQTIAGSASASGGTQTGAASGLRLLGGSGGGGGFGGAAAGR